MPTPADPPEIRASSGFAGRVALVTGAASGIGRATAIRLAADGALVVVLDRDGPGAEATVASIEATGREAVALVADVTDGPAITATIEAVVAAHGPIGVLVNNAGIPGGGFFPDVAFADWRRVLDTHVHGTFHVTQAVLPGMRSAGWGRIVNLSSESVWLGNQSVQYVTAKAALIGFTRALAYQLAPSGILVNAVAPGPVETPMLLDNDPAAIEAERAAVRIGRFLGPEEIAATIAFLVGPGGDGYVGQVLSPNGGTVFPG